MDQESFIYIITAFGLTLLFVPIILGAFLRAAIAMSNMIVTPLPNSEYYKTASPLFQSIKISLLAVFFQAALMIINCLSFGRLPNEHQANHLLNSKDIAMCIELLISYVLFVISIQTILPSSILRAIGISICFVFITAFISASLATTFFLIIR